jgi:sulfur carrier protein
VSFGILRFLFGGIKLICINGEKIEKNKIKLSSFLEENGINPQRIAVELNGEILSKSQYSNTVLKDGDVVEIVNFVGGG